MKKETNPSQNMGNKAQKATKQNGAGKQAPGKAKATNADSNMDD